MSLQWLYSFETNMSTYGRQLTHLSIKCNKMSDNDGNIKLKPYNMPLTLYKVHRSHKQLHNLLYKYYHSCLSNLTVWPFYIKSFHCFLGWGEVRYYVALRNYVPVWDDEAFRDASMDGSSAGSAKAELVKVCTRNDIMCQYMRKIEWWNMYM